MAGSLPPLDGIAMDQHRIAQATEAAARALHESVRDGHQFKWEMMTPKWRAELCNYVRPAVVAALQASDQYQARERPKTRHPKLGPIRAVNDE
jgi:hypothetical protein